MEQQGTSTAVTRRTLVRAAAWSVPVIAVAVATPLAAASTSPLIVQMNPATVDGSTFDWPGALVTNTGTSDVTLTWTVDVTPALDSLTGPVTGTITIPAGGSAMVAVGVTGFHVAAAWDSELTLALLRDGAPQTETITFRAVEV
ncbi:hypothetical protein [Microbacterium oxydans]|jgi:hypothetical protein|uniref:hypothetical protein n=1 Tax=Microbacterium oxydans TaxID=82380 RepID=UPI00226B4175|nr:hypothetical protein [Microbacterium oxydans]WAA65718.1 hypothetical protein MME74_16035 [Microbacterium oxydans]